MPFSSPCCYYLRRRFHERYAFRCRWPPDYAAAAAAPPLSDAASLMPDAAFAIDAVTLRLITPIFAAATPLTHAFRAAYAAIQPYAELSMPPLCFLTPLSPAAGFRHALFLVAPSHCDGAFVYLLLPPLIVTLLRH